jgi:hypothetical protein
MSYYWIDNTPQLKYAICDKCNDRYVMYSGRFSQRRSCRRHDWKNGFCRDCHLKKNSVNNSKGCYHASIPLCCETYCTIS